MKAGDASTTLVVAERFEGVPGAAHGGYAAGLLARAVPRVSEVTLRHLPPLARALKVRAADDGTAAVYDGKTLVLEGRPGPVDLPMPNPVSLAEAAGATAGHQGFVRPFSARCFVCSASRPDSLRVWPGPVAGREVLATPWTPPALFADQCGAVPAEIVWAVCDCLTGWAIGAVSRPALTGRLACRMIQPIQASTTHVAMAWALPEDGRKRPAGAAIVSERGELLAIARATWVSVSADLFRGLMG